MKHLIEDNPAFFKFLTAEEQLDEIREFIYLNSSNFTSAHLTILEKWLAEDTRSKNGLINEVARVNHVFCCETSNHVLSDKQKEELQQLGATTMVVPHARDNVFTFWARSAGLTYKQIIEHTTVSAREYIIWREDNNN